jgi:hypothetical protein
MVIYVDQDTGDPSGAPIQTDGTIDTESIDVSEYEGYDIISAGGESQITEGSFEVGSYINDNMQTFMVADEQDNIYMMSRESISGRTNIELSAESTALAMVSVHPLFASVSAEDYPQIKQLIMESPKFGPFLDQVKIAISQKMNLYDVENVSLIIALNDLMEDLCGDIDLEDGDFSDNLEGAIAAAYQMTRAIYNDPSVYPFYADITSNVLTLRNTGVTPSYYGSVIGPDGSQTSFSVPSKDDYGVLDLFKSVEDINLGEPRTYTFSQEGKYRFYLSRMNEAATADFYLRMVNSIFSTLGLNVSESVLLEGVNIISRAMINAGSGVNDAVTDPMAWVSIGFDAVLE